MHKTRYEKAPRGKLLGVFVLGCFFAFGVQASCVLPESADRETAQLEAVHDGDSLRLQDGRRVRLLGVNAPEIGRAGEPAQPLAHKARALVQRLLADSERLQLVYDTEREDRFGRTLAHVYDDEGRSLEAELLTRGLAFHVAIPPNLALAECLAGRQAQARRRSAGLWSQADYEPLDASDLTPEHAGFQWVKGQVKDVALQGGNVWLELDGPLALRVAAEDRKHFKENSDEAWRAWEGRTLRITGWLIDRYGSRAHEQGFKPLMMRLRTPHALLSPKNKGP